MDFEKNKSTCDWSLLNSSISNPTHDELEKEISSIQEKYIGAVILGLSLLKFFGVAFQFMELKHAHPFWKNLLVIFGSVFIVIILGITNL